MKTVYTHRELSGGRMRRTFWVIILFFSSFYYGYSGQIYVTTAEWNSNLKVYFTEHRYEADLVVYVSSHAYEARGKDAIWHYVQYQYQAGVKIFVTQKSWQANLKVYVTPYRYEAGWRRSHSWTGRLSR